MGATIPVAATRIERPKLARRDWNDVARPPEVAIQSATFTVRQPKPVFTFIYNEDQPQIAELNHNILGFNRQQLQARSAPSHPNQDLADETAKKPIVQDPTEQVEQQ